MKTKLFIIASMLTSMSFGQIDSLETNLCDSIFYGITSNVSINGNAVTHEYSGINWSEINHYWSVAYSPSDYNIISGNEQSSPYVIEFNNGADLTNYSAGLYLYYYDSLNNVFCSDTLFNENIFILNVNKVSTSKISIYPNPATSFVKIIGKNISNVDVIDLTGKKIENLLWNQESELNISSLNNGVYQIVVTTIEGVFTSKLMVQN